MKSFFILIIVFLIEISHALITITPHGVLDQLTKVFGRNYHDSAVFVAKQFNHYLLPTRTTTPQILSSPKDHITTSMKRYYFSSRGSSTMFLLCSEYKHSSALFDAVSTPHQIYASAKENLYCVKSKIDEDTIDALSSRSDVTLSLLIPFPSLIRLDTTVHHLFHYLLQDSLTEHAFHPFVQHYLSSKKIAVSVILHGDDVDKRQLVQKWRTGMSLTIKKDDFMKQFQDIFHLLPAEHRQHARDLTSLQVKGTASVFPLHHYTSAAASLEENLINQCPWAIMTNEDWDIRYHKYGMTLMLPRHFHQMILEEHPADRKYVTACLFRLLSTVLQSSEVRKIAFVSPVHTLNNLARQIIQSGAKNGGEIYGNLGLRGENTVIGVADTGIDENSCFFIDPVNGKVPRSSENAPYTNKMFRKVVQYVNFSGSGGDYNDGHGSHVAGTLAGYCSIYSATDNASKNQYMGMAPAAQIAFFDMGMDNKDQDLILPEDLGHVFYPAFKAGARIHSNSWGGDVFYDSLALEADEYLYQNPSFMAFFAAGNSGTAGKETVLSPGLSKNAIAVACSETGHSNTQNIGYVASFSSNGPTFDGRIKPDITGPGNLIYSAKAHTEHASQVTCEVVAKAGTSMATPVVAGNAALILQYFQDPKFWKSLCNPVYSYCQRGNFSLSGVLLKALVLQSGQAMTAYHSSSKIVGLSTPPDTYQGYGRVNLLNILPVTNYEQSDLQLFLEENRLSPLSERRYYVNFNSVSTSLPLKVTLSWIDPPNHEFVAQVNLNDLDLVVTDPAGNVFYGNTNNQIDQPVLGAQRDEVNNNEQVTIYNPQAGLWTISVQAKALSGSYSQRDFDNKADVSQSFALVITTSKVAVVDASESQLRPISMALLQQCARYDSFNHPKLSLDVMLWARVVGKGWYSADHYSLQQLSSPDGSALTSYQGNFVGSFPFYRESVCLDSGRYLVELVVNDASQSARGSQLSIPQCNQIFLTPMAPKQTFTIINTSRYVDRDFDNTSYNLYPWKHEKTCLMSCYEDNHLLLTTIMTEYAGEGWNGAYITLLEDRSSTSSSSSDAPFSVSDTLSWDYAEVHEFCLPPNEQCYLLQFSFPQGSEDDPQVLFPTASLTNHSEEGSCGVHLNTSISLAKFCIAANGAADAAVSIKFYSQRNSIVDLGMKLTNFDYSSYYQRYAADSAIIKAGECWLGLNYITVQETIESDDGRDIDPPNNGTQPLPHNDDPVDGNETFPSSPPVPFTTPLPSLLPSFAPSNSPSLSQVTVDTLVPTLATTTPSLSPTRGPQISSPPTRTPVTPHRSNYSINCMSDCRYYPGHIDFAAITEQSSVNETIVNKLCIFLQHVYPLCDSYSVASGVCYGLTAANPNSIFYQCLRDCSFADYCYLGAAMITSCPDAVSWIDSTDETEEIRKQCLASTESINQSTDNTGTSNTGTSNTDTSNGTNNSQLTVIFLIVIVVVIMLILGGFTFYSVWKTCFPHHFAASHFSYVTDEERNELPPSITTPNFIVNTHHTSQQPIAVRGRLHPHFHDDDVSSDGFHSPVDSRSPRGSHDSTKKKSFLLTNLRQQIYDNGKQLLSRKKQEGGSYEMVDLEDMNSSHPFRIMGSDDDMDMGDEREEEYEQNNIEETGHVEQREYVQIETTDLMSNSQREKERNEALEFLQDNPNGDVDEGSEAKL